MGDKTYSQDYLEALTDTNLRLSSNIITLLLHRYFPISAGRSLLGEDTDGKIAIQLSRDGSLEDFTINLRYQANGNNYCKKIGHGSFLQDQEPRIFLERNVKLEDLPSAYHSVPSKLINIFQTILQLT